MEQTNENVKRESTNSCITITHYVLRFTYAAVTLHLVGRSNSGLLHKVRQGGLDMRIHNSKLEPPARRGRQIQILVDGNPVTAYEGETVAATLIANSQFTFRYTAKCGSPRGVYCGIGLCHECRMVINDVPNVRACMTLVEPGMKVQSQNNDWRTG